MSKLKIVEIENGIFVPRGIISHIDLIYDQNRKIVIDSCVRRGFYKEKIVSEPPEYLPEKIEISPDYIDSEVLFLGYYDDPHFGHWLTEGVSRLWYFLENSEKNFIFLTGNKMRHPLTRLLIDFILRKETIWMKGINAMGIKFNSFRYVSEPAKVKNIIIPQCSMYEESEIADKHIEVTKKIANFLTKNYIFNKNNQPVYLSRTKLVDPVSTYIGEGQIERYCIDNNFRILYPEKMSLREQVIAFNEHDIFVGLIGSAFHSVLFRGMSNKSINIYLGPKIFNENYKLIDKLMGNESHHIQCCEVLEERRRYKCNELKAIAMLRDIISSLKFF